MDFISSIKDLFSQPKELEVETKITSEREPSIHPEKENNLASENISIEMHNQQIVDTLQSKLPPPQLGPSQHQVQGWTRGVMAGLSMQDQKQIILKDILTKCKLFKDNHELIDLVKITTDLEVQYKGSTLENLLNHMVHSDCQVNLKELIENNQSRLLNQN
jgi:hypothetical protein